MAWRPAGKAPPPSADFEFEYAECAHPAGQPVCWCRKPLPGLILEAAGKLDVDLGASLLIGDSPADATMAGRLGMRRIQLADFS